MSKIRLCGITHPGLIRRVNEDCFCLMNSGRHPDALAAVADGIGGHNSGDIASEVTCRSILCGCNAPGSPLNLTDANGAAAAMKELLTDINSRIVMINTLKQSRLPMGCTLVLAIFLEAKIVVFHAGDSRFYEYSEAGELLQHTGDQTLWANLIRKNHLTSDAPVPPQLSNVIMNAVGIYPELELCVKVLDFHETSSYLLCSDGLHHEVNDEGIRTILSLRQSRKITVQMLQQKALHAGGSDNIAIVYGNCRPE